MTSLACGRLTAAITSVIGLALVACAPALDWREARLDDGRVAMLFPCRPDRHERTVRLDGDAVRMQMHSCNAGGATYSLAATDAADPARVAPLLAAWRASAAANIGGIPAIEPLAISGTTPNPQSALLRIEGRLPDGRRVVEQAAFFVKGMRLYQAAAIGESIDAESARTFFDAIRLAP